MNGDTTFMEFFRKEMERISIHKSHEDKLVLEYLREHDLDTTVDSFLDDQWRLRFDHVNKSPEEIDDVIFDFESTAEEIGKVIHCFWFFIFAI